MWATESNGKQKIYKTQFLVQNELNAVRHRTTLRTKENEELTEFGQLKSVRGTTHGYKF